MSETVVKSKYDLQHVIDKITVTHSIYGGYGKNKYSFYVETNFFKRIGFTNLYEILENAVVLRCCMLDDVKNYTISQKKLINSEDIIIQATNNDTGKEIFTLVAYILTDELFFKKETTLEFSTFIKSLQNALEYKRKEEPSILYGAMRAQGMYRLMANLTDFIRNCISVDREVRIEDITFGMDKFSIIIIVYNKYKPFLICIEAISDYCNELSVFEIKSISSNGEVEKGGMFYFKEIRLRNYEEKSETTGEVRETKEGEV